MVTQQQLGRMLAIARPRARAWWPASGIVLLAFVVRLVYNLTAAWQYKPIYDAALYDFIARHILERHCYCIYGTHVSVSRAPLWPWIMTAVYSIFGEQNFFARLFLCLLGSATCLLVYRFAGDLFGKRAAIIAGVIAAVYTGLFLYDGWLYTESLYTFCLTAFTYTLYRFTNDTSPVSADKDGGLTRKWRVVHGYRWAIVCGLSIAAASLTRPNGVVLIGLLALWAGIIVAAKIKPWRAVLKSALLSTVIAVVLVAPWTYRNYTVAQAFIPVETGLGEVLLGSYNDKVAFGNVNVRGMWSPPRGTLNHDVVGYTPQTDSQYTAQALAWMRLHPATVVYLLGLHFTGMWHPYTYSFGLPIEEYPDRVASKVVWVLIFVESIPIFLLAMLGLVTTWKRWKHALIPLYLLMGATIAQNMVFYGSMRFRAPIEPLLAVLASGAIITSGPYVRGFVTWLVGMRSHLRIAQPVGERAVR